MPEVALTIISHTLAAVEKGVHTRDSNEYPVVGLHKYEVSPKVDEVAAGKSIELRYAIVMRCEFVSVGKNSGAYLAVS